MVTLVADDYTAAGRMQGYTEEGDDGAADAAAHHPRRPAHHPARPRGAVLASVWRGRGLAAGVATQGGRAHPTL
jgi:hypothetical protein